MCPIPPQRDPAAAGPLDDPANSFIIIQIFKIFKLNVIIYLTENYIGAKIKL